MMSVFLKLAIMVLILCTGSAIAGWFGPDHPDHYYSIYTKFVLLHSKGEPWEKDGFIVYIANEGEAPSKIKKDQVDWIHDDGTLSPRQVREQEAKEQEKIAQEEQKKREFKSKITALFKISDKTKNPHFVPETLAQARNIPATDEQIKEVIVGLERKIIFSKALQANYSLDDLAKFFQKMENGEEEPIEKVSGREGRASDPTKPYEIILSENDKFIDRIIEGEFSNNK
jgi:hypothetical protein